MKIKNLFIFGVGAAIGAAITYKLVSDKYESIIQEEVESVKESLGLFSKAVDEEDCEKEVEDTKENPKVYEPLKGEKKDYENMIAYHQYHKSSDSESDEEEVVEEENDNPLEFHKIESPDTHSFKNNIYVIPPQEYGVIDDYELIDLTLYSDNVLCDDMDEVVEDVDNSCGRDYINHFGDYDEPEVVHVRNDILRCDYEITKDSRLYADVVLGRPHYVD